MAWNIGASHTITWSMPDVLSDVKIELSRDNGSTWETIVASTANDGSYSWVVSGEATNQALIKISGLEYTNPDDGSIIDFSDITDTSAQFEIAVVDIPTGDLAAVLALLEVINNKIGSANSFIRTPFVYDFVLSIVRGSSYYEEDGRAIQFDLTDDTTIPSLTGASVAFIGAKNAQSVPIESLTIAGTITGRILKIELSSAQTLQFTAGTQRYDIVITLLNGHAIHYVNRSVLKVCPAVA